MAWWINFLQTYIKRSISTSIQSRPLVVTYSDGEGDTVGVGVCIYSSKLTLPLAAFTRVPDLIRRLWSRRAGTGAYHEILRIEAIGPLVLLHNYPAILRGSAWVHYIDNTASQHALLSGDHVVGATWAQSAALDCWPYFERVHTKSNPIDGVNSGDFSGPW